MEAIFKSKTGKIYNSAYEALCDDVLHSDFVMFTETGEPCNNIAVCSSVWCPTPESVKQFNEFRLSAQRFLDVRFFGSIEEGLNQYDESVDDWFLVGTPSAMADISTAIRYNIALMKREGKW